MTRKQNTGASNVSKPSIGGPKKAAAGAPEKVFTASMTETDTVEVDTGMLSDAFAVDAMIVRSASLELRWQCISLQRNSC